MPWSCGLRASMSAVVIAVLPCCRSNGGCGDEGRADVLTMGKRREALNMPAEQPCEHLGLGLAQLREGRGDVLHRAVALAQLDATGAHGPGARGVPVRGQCG